jgi:hypothetical protein
MMVAMRCPHVMMGVLMHWRQRCWPRQYPMMRRMACVMCTRVACPPQVALLVLSHGRKHPPQVGQQPKPDAAAAQLAQEAALWPECEASRVSGGLKDNEGSGWECLHYHK